MEPLKKFILRIAMLAALITFLSCMLNGISIATSIYRSVVVYLLSLLLVVIMLNILRWGIWITSSTESVPKTDGLSNQEENVNEEKTE